jgi:hypothetical protein
MFYTSLFMMLPQWAKNTLGAGLWIAGGIYAVHANNLFPEYFGLEKYNKVAIEQVKADNAAAYIAEVKAEASALVPCGDSVSACEMLETNPELYAKLTADGTPVTRAKMEKMLKDAGF